jgi:serine/threonine-protein kinase
LSSRDRVETGTDVKARADGNAGPRRFGRYEVCRKIADGGMAAVYVARRLEGPRRGELVAIKTIRGEFASNREFVTMFMDEAEIVSRLRHPNVVRHHELGNDGGHAYLVMELLSGQSLWSVWEACRARGKRLDYDTIAWIGARVASGLHYAHELRDDQGKPLDIVHRDVNATNIFVTYDGDVKVIDFGLAKAANRVSKTAAGVIKGKVAYMSPEQAVGAPIDRRTDVFALGTTLWELGCDRRLFKDSDDLATLKRVHAAVVPDPTKLIDGFPRQLWRVLDRALARDRDKRYASAADLATDLDAFALGEDEGASFAPRAAPMSLVNLMRDLFAGARAGPEAVECVTEAEPVACGLEALATPLRSAAQEEPGPTVTIELGSADVVVTKVSVAPLSPKVDAARRTAAGLLLVIAVVVASAALLLALAASVMR